MKLWQFIRQRIKEVETNKNVTWANLRPALHLVYFEMWERSYYDEQKKQHAKRRQKFLNGGV